MRWLPISLLVVFTACSSSQQGPDGAPTGSETGGGGNTSGDSAGGTVRLDAGSGGSLGTGAGGGGVGGTAGAGASAGTGGRAGSGGSAGGDGGAKCAPNPGLPANAPALTTGVWKNISPAGVNFHSTGGTDVFTQGITVDPCNPATLYLSVSSFDLAGGKPGVYKSVDAGSTWAKVGPLDEPIHVRIDPKDPNHLYAADGVRGGTMGFWVSLDGGATWALPKGFTDLCATAGITSSCGMSDVYDVAADPSDFNHVLLTFHSPFSWDDFNRGAGVVETKDGGATWIVHDPQAGWGQGHGIWYLSSSTTWLLGTQGDGFLRTSDGGVTWTQVEAAACAPACDVGNNMQHGGGQIFRTSSGVVYAGGTPHLMRSKDDGVTWTLLAPTAGYNGIVGDGTNLYTAPNTEPGALGPGFITATESNDTVWTEYPGGTVLNGGGGASGPFEMAFDAANGIVYAGCWSAGLWALKVH